MNPAHALRPAPQPMPRWRRWLLGAATLLALCVYYVNYGTPFEEGITQGGTQFTMPGRVLAVLAALVALAPLRLRADSALLCAVLFLASAMSLLLGAGLHGGLNDVFFVNTLLQLPVLLALVGSRWQADPARWLRFVCAVLALQVAVDALVWQLDASLWLSSAFVGGVGNPSSFGLLCAMGCAFCLLHPRCGRGRWPLALTLAFGAVMSKSLFAVLAVALLAGLWMLRDWRRLLLGSMVAVVGALAALTLLVGSGDDDDVGFLEHKLNAAGALFGLVEYDVESSATVAQRLEMHERTFAALADAPQRLLWGHLDGQPYWPMDSQLLTYLGSFGAPMLVVFVALHLVWMQRAWRRRREDGGFALAALALFGLIFATNRVLDYFPVAAMYFLLVAMVLRPPLAAISARSAASRWQPARGSTRSSAPGPRPAAP